MTNVVSRENIETWDANSPKLQLFRRAVEEMQKISDTALGDERGYQWVAGVHGGFGGQPYCEHGTPYFLVWHRPYVLDIETKLRVQIKKIAGPAAADQWRLPYWDWAAPGVTGLPAAFTAKTYKDGTTSKPNPLYSMPYRLGYPPGPPVPDTAKETYRNPGPLAQLRSLGPMVVAALKEPLFADFTRNVEQPHNGLHIWVNGFMATFRSSFDPIFWCHHANVDRQFWLWQQKYGDSSIPDNVRNFTCRPFRFEDNRASAFFDTRALGYTYANARLSVPRAEAVLKAKGGDTEAPLPATLTVALGDIRGDVQRARLHLHGLHHTEASYEIRVFGNRKSASADTPTTSRSNYLGSFFLLGHGNCPGAPGHCAVRTGPEFSGDVRAPHHLAPYDAVIDVTAGVRKLTAAKKGKARGELRLSFVVLDASGEQVPNQKIEFDDITVTTD